MTRRQAERWSFALAGADAGGIGSALAVCCLGLCAAALGIPGGGTAAVVWVVALVAAGMYAAFVRSGLRFFDAVRTKQASIAAAEAAKQWASAGESLADVQVRWFRIAQFGAVDALKSAGIAIPAPSPAWPRKAVRPWQAGLWATALLGMVAVFGALDPLWPAGLGGTIVLLAVCTGVGVASTQRARRETLARVGAAERRARAALRQPLPYGG